MVYEVTAAVVADRVGLCRTVFVALAASAAVYATLGGIGHAAFAIVAWFVTFEATVVVLVACSPSPR